MGEGIGEQEMEICEMTYFVSVGMYYSVSQLLVVDVCACCENLSLTD